MILNDNVEIAGVRQTKDGYWIVDCLAAKGGNIQRYAGWECGRPDLATVDVLRPVDEVFRADSLASYGYKPVVVGHPKGGVSVANWKDVSAGTIGAEVVRDQDAVRVSLALMDQSAIDAVRQGVRDISMGYECRLEFVDGVTDDGRTYNAIQRDIKINHAAIVPVGRAGPECSIGRDARVSGVGDATTPTPTPSTNSNGGRAVPESNVRPVLLDGLTIHTNDAGAEAISRLQRQLADTAAAVDAAKAEAVRVADGLRGQIAAMTTQHAEAMEARDGEVAALKAQHAEILADREGELTATKAMIPDAAAMDALIEARLATANDAARIFGDGFDPRGKTEAEMRRVAVAKRLGDALVTPMSDAEVGGAFRALLASNPVAQRPDPMRQAIIAGAGAPVADAAPQKTAHEEFVEYLRTAHRHAGKEG